MLRFVEKHVHGHQFHISMNNIIDKKELERRTNEYNRELVYISHDTDDCS